MQGEHGGSREGRIVCFSDKLGQVNQAIVRIEKSAVG